MKKEYDAILIPGGGLTEDGQLTPWSKARVETALSVANHHSLFITLSGGTVYKPPPVDDRGFPIYESHAAAKLLIAMGIPPHQILTETSSFDTIGNAFFARVIHTDPRQLKNLLIVTSEFHLARTKALFNWIFHLLPTENYQLSFVASPNKGITTEVLAERIKKEQQGLQKIEKHSKYINTMKSFHTWLFLQHGAYATGVSIEKISDRLKSSY